jgi:hypothetical protein
LKHAFGTNWLTLPRKWPACTVPALVAASFPIDSLDVVGILCKVDELVGFNLPHGVVRAGGYDSINEALKHLMPRIAKEWAKRKGAAV